MTIYVTGHNQDGAISGWNLNEINHFDFIPACDGEEAILKLLDFNDILAGAEAEEVYKQLALFAIKNVDSIPVPESSQPAFLLPLLTSGLEGGKR